MGRALTPISVGFIVWLLVIWDRGGLLTGSVLVGGLEDVGVSWTRGCWNLGAREVLESAWSRPEATGWLNLVGSEENSSLDGGDGKLIEWEEGLCGFSSSDSGITAMVLWYAVDECWLISSQKYWILDLEPPSQWASILSAWKGSFTWVSLDRISIGLYQFVLGEVCADHKHNNSSIGGSRAVRLFRSKRNQSIQE
jgi:hypothetical protein